MIQTAAYHKTDKTDNADSYEDTDIIDNYFFLNLIRPTASVIFSRFY